ncbi:hypothetical protein GGI35DRAFT_55976 [Trichoderma velutinum]
MIVCRSQLRTSLLQVLPLSQAVFMHSASAYPTTRRCTPSMAFAALQDLAAYVYELGCFRKGKAIKVCYAKLLVASSFAT